MGIEYLGLVDCCFGDSPVRWTREYFILNDS